MAIQINMPQITDTMEEGFIGKWFVKKGDKISKGDVLAEINLDVAYIDLDSFYEGVVLFIATEEYQIIPVGELLCIVGEEGEDISGFLYQITPPKKVFRKRIRTIPTSTFTLDKITTLEGVELIVMPKMSDTMEEGIVSIWHKKVGDTIKEGDVLADIETDRAIMEFESFYNGTLLYKGVKNGQSLLVDGILAIIGPAGTDVSEIIRQTNTTMFPVETPGGVEVIRIPELHTTSEERIVTTWYKKVGESIKKKELLAKVETDREVIEFKPLHTGTLLYKVEGEQTVSANMVLAIIETTSTSIS
nr:biotin/lipoyl-containing protein [Aquimarina algiphila]